MRADKREDNDDYHAALSRRKFFLVAGAVVAGAAAIVAASEHAAVKDDVDDSARPKRHRCEREENVECISPFARTHAFSHQVFPTTSAYNTQSFGGPY